MKNTFCAQEVFLFNPWSPQVKQIRHNRITAVLEHEQAEGDQQPSNDECAEPHQSVRVLFEYTAHHEPSTDQ